MRVVFFTNKSGRGVEILRQMEQRHIRLEAIFIDVGGRQQKNGFKKIKTTHKRMGLIETLKLIHKRVSEEWIPRPQEEWKRNEFYHSYSDKVYIVDTFNGEYCERLLKEIEPDIVVLGGSRILRNNIIAVPKIGILNAHPGLLPKYRGVDVIPWAIYHGDPVGVTIHFIDEGVDTGRLVAQKVINLREGDTLGKLMKRANRVAGELMSDVVLQLIEAGQIQGMPQSREDGKQFYRMSIKQRQETEKKLKEMVAAQPASAESRAIKSRA